MSILAAASAGAGLAAGLLGDKKAPQIQAVKVDPVDELLASLGFNEQNFGRFSELSKLANRSNIDQVQETLSEFGFTPFRERLTEQFNKELDGQVLTQGDVDLIRRQSGARAFGAGTQGSGASVNQFAKELSLSSANLRQQKLSNAVRIYESLYSTTPIPTPVSTQGQFFTPGQALAVAEGNANREQAARVFNAGGGADAANANTDNFWAGIGDFIGGIQGATSGAGNPGGATLSNLISNIGKGVL